MIWFVLYWNRKKEPDGGNNMDSHFQSWLEEEIQWYRKNNRPVRRKLIRVAAGVAVFIELLFGAFGLFRDKIIALPYYFGWGFLLILFSCVPYLAVSLYRLRPKMQAKLLYRAMKETLTKEEQGQFASEMAAGFSHPECSVEYCLPNSGLKHAARFALTEHYAFQEGGDFPPVAVHLENLEKITFGEVYDQNGETGTKRRRNIPSALFAVDFWNRSKNEGNSVKKVMFFPHEAVYTSVIRLLEKHAQTALLLKR